MSTPTHSTNNTNSANNTQTIQDTQPSSLTLPIHPTQPERSTRPKQAFFGSLSLRIMLMFVALLGMGLTVVISLLSLILHMYLTNEVDKSLISSGQMIATKTAESIMNGSEVQLLPSEFYFYIDFPYTSPIQVAHSDVIATYGTPKNPESLLQKSITSESTPFTTEGTNNTTDWRVIVVSLESTNASDPNAHVLVALPLFSVDQGVNNLTSAMVALALIIILVGGFLSYVMAQQALRGVRTIERVTHQVADGNLASRVPSLPPNTEVGALSLSINSMLANIEHAFEVQLASEQRMRQFVSDASHELRTPLATVRGYAELYRMGGVPNEQLDHAFARIESESTRMGNLVEDLLKLARLDEGRGLTFTAVNLTAAAVDAVDDFIVRAPERSASVVALDGSALKPVTVMADSDKVQQVIANLLSNVLTHTPSDAAVEVAVGINPQADNEAIVEVRDHGPGIRASDRKHIFERFYRTDASRSRNTGGTGLGLSIVAATLAAHGGTARVYETPGGGLTVRLTFPNVVRRG